MLQKYKEIFYGGLFGFGAGSLDTVLDARMEGLTFGDEIVQHHPMLFYRTLFIFFGLALGWLLWQKNKREREFRDLSEILKRFRQEYRYFAGSELNWVLYAETAYHFNPRNGSIPR